MDCEDMTSLRVLKMNCNKLTSIHGLSGAENLHILELSHNSIARIGNLFAESNFTMKIVSINLSSIGP